MSARAKAGTAFAVSALAHLLFLALLLTIRPALSARPLVVRLLALATPSVAGPLAGTLDGRGATLPKEASHPPRVVRAKPLQPAVAEAPSAASATAAPEAAQQRVPLPGVSDAPAAEGGTREGAPAVSSAIPGGASLREARLGELHRRLAEAAARCYPAAARRFRLTGEVPLHFCLDAGGTATALSLEGSTGSPLLDRSALECVVPGAQPLSGFEGCFLVPVRFGG